MNQIPAKVIRQVFVILLILFMGSLIFKEMLPYLTGVLGAVTIYVLFRKWMATLVKKKKWSPSLAALLIMFISFVGILVPIGGIVWMLSNKIGKAVNNSEQVIKAFKDQLSNVEHYLGFDISSKIDTGAITGWISENLQSVVGGTFNAFIAIGLM
ncbi:MAG: AI-2E family transporter, partial [Gelidibacter sp.]